MTTRERSERARASKEHPLALAVNKSPAGFIHIRALDDLLIENTLARRSLRGRQRVCEQPMEEDENVSKI